jgi:hypothetical protein
MLFMAIEALQWALASATCERVLPRAKGGMGHPESRRHVRLAMGGT